LRLYPQLFLYLPYFVSSVVVVGMFKQMMSLDSGVINDFIAMMGG
jgi:ABC-type polysaccharide transport system permease subunit